jgi:hypothetical protein
MSWWDCGLQRIPRFDVRSGMTRLVTVPVSRGIGRSAQGSGRSLGAGFVLALVVRGRRSIPGSRSTARDFGNRSVPVWPWSWQNGVCVTRVI